MIETRIEYRSNGRVRVHGSHVAGKRRRDATEARALAWGKSLEEASSGAQPGGSAPAERGAG
jgi:hypothetical protein